MVRRLPVLVLVLLLPTVARAGGAHPRRHPAHPKAAAHPLVIALDAGHGGAKSGAVGVHHLLEKNVTRRVIADLARRLRRQGYEVHLTRPGDQDVGLRERVRRANAWHADVFVSVHCNAVAGRRARRESKGIETYFLSADATDEAARRLAEQENAAGDAPTPKVQANPVAAILRDLVVNASQAESSHLADAIQHSLVRAMRWPDRGVRQAPFAVLNGAKMPAVLVEIGFITNPVEGRALGRPADQRRIAAAIGRGVRRFLHVLDRHRRPVQLAERDPVR